MFLMKFNLGLFLVKLGAGRKRSQLAIPATSEYNIGAANIDLTNMVGILKSPKGVSEPCLLKKMPDGKLGIRNDLHSALNVHFSHILIYAFYVMYYNPVFF